MGGLQQGQESDEDFDKLPVMKEEDYCKPPDRSIARERRALLQQQQ